ncbi:MAG: UPF0182 family protein, partial [Acidobacteriota bacterium]
MRKLIIMTAVVVAFFILVGGLSFAIEMYFDYLWFAALGITVVFTTALYAKSLMGTSAVLVGFLFVFLNVLIANRAPGLIQLGIPTPTGQITAYTVSPEVVRRISALVAILVGLVPGYICAENWEKIWRWIHAVPFNAEDPIFSRDVSFYMFTIPFYRELINIGLILGFLTLVGVLALYYFKGALSWKKLRGSEGSKSRLTIQVSLLAAFVFFLLSVSAFLNRYEVLFGNHEVFAGAGYTDLNARVPMLMALSVC